MQINQSINQSIDAQSINRSTLNQLSNCCILENANRRQPEMKRVDRACQSDEKLNRKPYRFGQAKNLVQSSEAGFGEGVFADHIGADHIAQPSKKEGKNAKF